MLANPRDRYFKNKGFELGNEIGIAIGIEQGKRETAKYLFKKGFSVEEIVEITGSSTECVYRWIC